jgi:uncharacterized lipoprotein NlpE involved in copper resistance
MKKILVSIAIAVGSFALIGCGNKAANPGAVKVDEVVNSAIADRDAWMGKEVAVTGYVMMNSSLEGQSGFTMSLVMDKDSRNSESGNSVNCTVQGGVSKEEVVLKTVEVKGKIKRVDGGGKWKVVLLDPCELKN